MPAHALNIATVFVDSAALRLSSYMQALLFAKIISSFKARLYEYIILSAKPPASADKLGQNTLDFLPNSRALKNTYFISWFHKSP